MTLLRGAIFTGLKAIEIFLFSLVNFIIYNIGHFLINDSPEVYSGNESIYLKIFFEWIIGFVASFLTIFFVWAICMGVYHLLSDVIEKNWDWAGEIEDKFFKNKKVKK